MVENKKLITKQTNSRNMFISLKRDKKNERTTLCKVSGYKQA